MQPASRPASSRVDSLFIDETTVRAGAGSGSLAVRVRQSEDRVDRGAEQPRQLQGEGQARLEAAGFDRIDRLARDSDFRRQLRLRPVPLGTQLLQPAGYSHLRTA